MHDEATTFFEHLRTEDRPLTDLLDADYTFLNADLAKHYGIGGVDGKAMQRVALKPEHRRGGLLGMGAVLAMTSHTNRTSPTLRGRWVLDVLFGTPPPPPPPDAGQIDDAKKGEAKSFREQLAQHASQPSCLSCHRKMDPLGFALDNYDAVGAWRDRAGDKPLDTSGELPGGERINGAAELKELVKSRRDAFVENLVRRAMTYALARDLDGYDEAAVHEVRARVAREGYRTSALVMGVAQSLPFQYRRAPAAQDAAASAGGE
jgi:hypothetical protein